MIQEEGDRDTSYNTIALDQFKLQMESKIPSEICFLYVTGKLCFLADKIKAYSRLYCTPYFNVMQAKLLRYLLRKS